MAYWDGTRWAPEPVAVPPVQRAASVSRQIKPAALIAVLTLVVAAGSVFAGKNATEPWIGLATVDGSRMAAASVQPSLGSWVTFDSTYPNNVKNPRIVVNCYQAGSLTFGMGGALDYSFQLGGAGSIWLWNGGEADCSATLFYFGFHAGHQTFNELAHTDFHAGA